MPDTLPAPWTWQNVPHLERAVLSGISAIFGGIQFGTRLLSPTEIAGITYGIEIWRRLPFMILNPRGALSVYVLCTEKVVLVRHGYSDAVFELAKPDSLDKAISHIRSTIGASN